MSPAEDFWLLKVTSRHFSMAKVDLVGMEDNMDMVDSMNMLDSIDTVNMHM